MKDIIGKLKKNYIGLAYSVTFSNTFCYLEQKQHDLALARRAGLNAPCTDGNIWELKENLWHEGMHQFTWLLCHA